MARIPLLLPTAVPGSLALQLLLPLEPGWIFVAFAYTIPMALLRHCHGDLSLTGSRGQFPTPSSFGVQDATCFYLFGLLSSASVTGFPRA